MVRTQKPQLRLGDTDKDLPKLNLLGTTWCQLPEVPVAGRLHHFLPFWKKIGADSWVIEVVQQGYRLDLISEPAFQGIRSTRAVNSASVLTEEVRDLMMKGAVVPVPLDQKETGYYSTYFIVPKKDGGLRPILNLKWFNFHVTKVTFRMETLPAVIETLSPGLWLASIDLKDAYFHVAMNPVHQKFLRFFWEGRAYQYVTLPFGLTSAPRVFTKVLAPVVAHIRTLGVHICAYLDDLLIAGPTIEEANQAVSVVANTLVQAGFILNLKKSELVPTQDLVYIGGRLRTDLGYVFLPEDRLTVLVNCVKTFLHIGMYKPAHQWLRLLGLMAATLLVVHQARLNMRPIQWHVKLRWKAVQGLKAPVMVSAEVVQALQWWLCEQNLRTGLPFHPPPPHLTVGTDASKEGWGGHAVIDGRKAMFEGLWTPSESRLHINILEMRAIRLTLHNLESRIRSLHVRVESDNTSAVAYINKQGGVLSRSLWEETRRLFLFLNQHQIQLSAVFRPGVDNSLADYLSRNQSDPHEWKLSPFVVRRLFEIWGHPQLDAFASPNNHQLSIWFSRSPHQEAAATDALTQSWTGLKLYAFPPIPLILKVLAKIKLDRAEEVILIVPTWPRRIWYQLLLQLVCSPPFLLPLQMDLLSQTLTGKGTLYHSNLKSLHLAAWRLSGQTSRVQAFQRLLLQQHSRQREPHLEQSMTLDGQHGVAGVVKGVPIRFMPL